MIAMALGVVTIDQALRVVRALGAHRYVAGRLHLVHAAAIASLDGAPEGLRVETYAWARAILGATGIDQASRDERLWRSVMDAELAAIMAAYWAPESTARDSLRAWLGRYDLPIADHVPFDEHAEKSMHPLLIDAGWELLPLAGLDAERHKGAVTAFGDAAAFNAACLEAESKSASMTPIYELPAIGPVELLRAMGPNGGLLEPLVVWVQGHPTYLDYVLRGVRRAAKIDAP